jgi:hypothetical protein
VSSFIDESGILESEKLTWNDDAWTQLLFGAPTDENLKMPKVPESGRMWQCLMDVDVDYLRELEEQLLYSRLILTFGWAASFERLCILGVEW